MGYEYKLDFEPADQLQADLILRGIPGFETCTGDGLYFFRRDATGAMPDAFAKIEPSGIYVCDNGGAYQIVKDIQTAFAAVGLDAEPREL